MTKSTRIKELELEKEILELKLRLAELGHLPERQPTYVPYPVPQAPIIDPNHPWSPGQWGTFPVYPDIICGTTSVDQMKYKADC